MQLLGSSCISHFSLFSLNEIFNKTFECSSPVMEPWGQDIGIMLRHLANLCQPLIAISDDWTQWLERRRRISWKEFNWSLIREGTLNREYFQCDVETATGVYSCLSVDMMFKRQASSVCWIQITFITSFYSNCKIPIVRIGRVNFSHLLSSNFFSSVHKFYFEWKWIWNVGIPSQVYRIDKRTGPPPSDYWYMYIFIQF